MILGVLSDTHRDQAAVDRAFRLFQQHGATAVLCLGDLCSDVQGKDEEYAMEVICTAGNMDVSGAFPLLQVYEADGVRILMAHGHTLDVRSGHARLLEEARQRGCQAALYGHTHIPFNSKEHGILVLNPGSAAQPRGNSKASAALIDTAGGKLWAKVFWLKDGA